MKAVTLPPVLTVSKLALGIGPRALIRNLCLEVHAGELWCILGANGVGKTLFLYTLVGLRRVQSGSVRIFGKSLEQWPVLEAAQARAFLPQKIYDAFGGSALDIVLMGRHPHLSRWQWEGEEDRGTALAALHAVGLKHLAAQDVTTLSGGERQRVAIAALLAQDAPLLLLDEPVAHLDLHHQIMVLRHLGSLAREQARAVLFSIHDLNLARRFATHAMLFREDGIVDSGPIDEVMNAPALSSAFRYPVTQMKGGQQTVFVPD